METKKNISKSLKLPTIKLSNALQNLEKLEKSSLVLKNRYKSQKSSSLKKSNSDYKDFTPINNRY